MHAQPDSTTEYRHLGTPSPPRDVQFRLTRKCILLAASLAVVSAVSLIMAGVYMTDGHAAMISLRAVPAIPHTGEWCQGSGAKLFSKKTLKRIADRTIYGLLRYDATAGESKFEASDVVRVGDYFYVVCDSSWSILKLSDSLPLLSRDNELIRHDASFDPPSKEDSGFEAIIHDASSLSHGAGHEDFYVVRESVEHATSNGNTVFDAQVMKMHIAGSSYSVVETCHSEFKFEGNSKGFEGAISLRGADGVLYLLGLCEGNFCEETRGKEAGNGRVVVMAKEVDEHAPGGCLWKTKRLLSLPPTVNFVDYSAFAVHHSTQAVAITSQENSQLWVGELSGGSDGAFDPETAEFTAGEVFDFPRESTTCEVQYCNIEGIHWVSGKKDEGTPQMLVAVSDKMKSKGRQGATCQDKDQSVHLFTLP
jgi:hypothetical protein